MTTMQSKLLALIGTALSFLSLVLARPTGLVPSAQAQSTTQCQTTKIMPLGDSITVGRGSEDQAYWQDTRYMTGYRQPLYLALKERGYSIDFVGGEQAGQLTAPSFDLDHEGHSGYWPSHILYGMNGGPGISEWLSANSPDIVLLHIGTNGLKQGKTEADVDGYVHNIALILDRIDQHNRGTQVILALVINQNPYLSLVSTFNTKLRAMAERRIAGGDKIVVVDMEPALNYADDMADQLHPNKAGYQKIAQVWLSALGPMLTPCSAAANPTPTPTPTTPPLAQEPTRVFLAAVLNE